MRSISVDDSRCSVSPIVFRSSSMRFWNSVFALLRLYGRMRKLVTSFLILPYNRSKAKTEFQRRIEELRKTMGETLQRESSTEIDRMVHGIAAAFEPYQRFYATESEKVERFAAKLRTVNEEAGAIAGAIERL